MPNTGNTGNRNYPPVVGNTVLPKRVYLKLQDKTTFIIDSIEKFRYVHFIKQMGQKRKFRCLSNGCTYCNNGNNRTLRLPMSVIHNGDKKFLEVGSSLGHKIICSFVVGDTITIEKIGIGIGTRYNIIGALIQTSIPHVEGREEGIKELMYDIQRTGDYDEKYDLIKDFVRKY